MKKLIVLSVLALLGIYMAIPVHADDISTAQYYGVITVSNNSTANSSVATVFTGNTTAWAANGIMNTSGNNTSIRSSSGSALPYMPGYAGNKWCLWVASIGENTYKTDILYTGGTANMNGRIVYFPGSTGMTITDHATIEPSANFSTELSGWFDTSYITTNQTYTDKDDAYLLFNGASENITARFWSSTGNVSQTSYSAGESGGQAVFGANWVAQSFSVNTSVEIRSVRIKFVDTAGNPGDATVGIRQLDANDYPTGTDLTNAQRTATGMNGFYYWDLDDLIVPSGNYSVVMRIPGGDAGNQGDWRNDGAGASYSRGDMMTSVDSGATWTHNSGADCMFYIYGVVVPQTSASGVANGEHVIETELQSPFWSLAIDTSSENITPMTENLTMNAPLRQSECNNAFGNPFTTIDSNAISATVTNATWTNQGYSFDGATTDINLGNPASLNIGGHITLEAWINETALSAGHQGIIGKINSYYFAQRVNGKISIRIYPGAEVTSNDVLLTVGDWYYVAVTYDQSKIRLYINGVQTSDDWSQSGGIAIAANNCYIGDINGALKFNGLIDEARIYDKALSNAEILQNYNATKSKYTTGDIYTYSTVETVVNNANDWLVGYGGTGLKYMDRFIINVNGVETCNLTWEYGATFTDQSGNGNDGTPSFRGASGDSDISATLSSFLPISEARAPAYTLSSAPDFFSSTPGVSGNFTVNVTPSYPGHEIITTIAAAAPVPVQLPNMLIFTFILLAISIGISYMMKTTGVNSLFIKSSIITAIMAVYTAMGVYDVWMTYFFAMIALALMWLSRQREAY